jgi:hypothetical protein
MLKNNFDCKLCTISVSAGEGQICHTFKKRALPNRLIPEDRLLEQADMIAKATNS